jgi:hypothetical protein
MSAITATTTRTTTSRAAKLRRAAIASAAVLAMGAFAGCGGRDDTGHHASRGAAASASAPIKQDAPDFGSRSDWEPSGSGSTGSYDTGSTESYGSGPADSSGNQYPAEAKRSFMTSCVASSGGMKTFCGCALDHLEQTMTLDEVVHDGLKIVEGGRPSQKFYDAVRSCVRSSGGHNPFDVS